MNQKNKYMAMHSKRVMNITGSGMKRCNVFGKGTRTVSNFESSHGKPAVSNEDIEKLLEKIKFPKLKNNIRLKY